MGRGDKLAADATIHGDGTVRVDLVLDDEVTVKADAASGLDRALDVEGA